MKEIRQIIDFYDQLRAEETRCALAVVVDVAQSSYRRIGARLLVAEDGRFLGGISGGCLEGDALRRAKLAILQEKSTAHTYDTTDGDYETIGAGLGCEGRIKVQFTPIDFSDGRNEIELLRSLVTTRTPRLLMRVLNGEILAGPELLQPSERFPLAILSPHQANQIYLVATNLLREGRSKVLTVRGERGRPYKVLFEVLQPTIHLVLTGSNYDIPATLQAANLLGWQTTVIAARRKISKSIATLATRTLDYGEAANVRVDTATAVVLMSHDYDWDRRMVQHFLPQQPPYFGMLGPRKRMEKMATSIDHLDLKAYPNLYAPVGLDVGAETPEEIAASLTAEILMVFRGRNGAPLRERKGSIH